MNLPLPEKKGSLTGGILLVTGCCIGAGMLALPITTGIAGFFPALITFVVGWFFMMCTGLLLLEVNLAIGEGVSLISMAEKTLGYKGKATCWITYLFLFYSLMIAFVSGSGAIAVECIKSFTEIDLPIWVGSLFFSLFSAVIIFLGTRAVDNVNRLLVTGLILSYCALLFFGLPHVDSSRLTFVRWDISFFVLPVILISFGFHQLIPTLTDYMQSDLKTLKRAIFVGSLIPFFIYLFWNLIVLGIVPQGGENGIIDTLQKGMGATHPLIAIAGNRIATAAQGFAFFAMATTFISIAIGFMDFLADGLQIEKNREGRFFLSALVLLPPFILTLLNPHIFIFALNYAGGFGTTLLFVVLPPLMAWNLRYKQKEKIKELLPGGKALLIAIILFAIAVIFFEILQEVGLSPLPIDAETIP